MENQNVSTVVFKSNLQPVNASSCISDNEFLKHIRDPFALEILAKKGTYNLSPIQGAEYRNASLHCSYALPGDYPFGTIRSDDGQEHVVCKCINTSCHLFTSCRPDFDPSELVVLEENKKALDGTIKVSSVFNLTRQGDEKAAAELYTQKNNELQEYDSKSEHAKLVDHEELHIEYIPKEVDNLESEEAGQMLEDASFESFASVEQEQIIISAPEERIIVNAGPGTGKTWTLIEKIKYMLVNETADAEDILVLCFSKAAVEVIRNRLEAAADRGELPLEWHLVDVRTFDSFSTYMLVWLADNNPEMLPENYVLESQNYEQRIREATKVLGNNHDMLAGYRHIIVDEVQDLVGARAELVMSLLSGLPETCGFTLLGDSCQALYDYLATNNNAVMSSVDFYNSLFHAFPCANYFELDHNYRQGDTLGEFVQPYRQAILSGDSSRRAHEASRLESYVKSANVKLQHFSDKDAEEYLKKGTLGILTRTNGQALQISAWLRTEGVRHSLNRPMGSNDLAGWIADVVLSMDSQMLDINEFRTKFIELHPEAGSEWKKYWQALAETQRNPEETWIEIDDLIKGLITNPKHPLLFQEPGTIDNSITVSNIHRAKGREYDSVIVIEDVISAISEDTSDNDLEHKVCYVALTRPRDKIEKVVLPTQYIYISKNENRRCFKSGGFANRKYLSHFEIGDAADIAQKYFAETTERQAYIRSSLVADTRLKLLKCPEEGAFVRYKIVLEEDEHIILGYTSRHFAREIEQALQRIYNNYHHIAYKYFPKIFGDIYVDGRTTCVSATAKKMPGAKEFNGFQIWTGISVSGFAQMEKDRY